MTAFVTPATLLRSSTPSTRAVSASRSTFLASTRFSRACIVHPPQRQLLTPMANLESDVREELNKLFEKESCMPIMVRLGWHDAGTYKAEDGSGGANASIRHEPEKQHGANAGLQKAMDLLEPVKEKFPDISYADLYQLASVAAIEFAGGPKVPYRMGRVDASVEDCTPDGRLPDGGESGMSPLRNVFYRMGFSDQEITVLSGAHTLGRGHPDRSGFDGPWTKAPVKFDNTYYVEILKDEPDPDLLRMSSDLALLENPETKALCEKYAKDQDAFFKDYVPAHQKLSELGCFVKVA